MLALTIPQILKLLAFSVFLSCGQILFKMTASSMPPLTQPSTFPLLLTNIWFWLAISLYGLSTIFWITILQEVALSRAYPFAALGFVFVPFASWMFFKEPLSWTYAAGVALLVVALGLITAQR